MVLFICLASGFQSTSLKCSSIATVNCISSSWYRIFTFGFVSIYLFCVDQMFLCLYLISTLYLIIVLEQKRFSDMSLSFLCLYFHVDISLNIMSFRPFWLRNVFCNLNVFWETFIGRFIIWRDYAQTVVYILYLYLNHLRLFVPDNLGFLSLSHFQRDSFFDTFLWFGLQLKPKFVVVRLFSVIFIQQRLLL